MEERSTGLNPEKTDQSNTDDTPQVRGAVILGSSACRGWHQPKVVVGYGLSAALREKFGLEDSEKDWNSISDSNTFVEKLRLQMEYENNFKPKLDSRSVRYSKDLQVSLLLEKISSLHTEAMVLLISRNSNKYLMDEYLAEIEMKFRVLTKYVRRIFEGRFASGYNKQLRQLREVHERLKLRIKQACNWYRSICLTTTSSTKDWCERNHMLQQSFNDTPGNGVNSDPPQLSCSPDPKGKAMEVPSCHNSYEDNIEKEWNSPDLCHSNDSQIQLLTKRISDLETETEHLKDMIDYDKCHTQEIQEKFKILAKQVHEIPSSSGCNNPQLELLQKNYESLKSLIAEVIKPYSCGEDHSMASDDDHNQASPASSTTDADQFTHQLGMQDKKTKEHHEPQMAKNEADKCGHSCSHQHVIDIHPENEAVEDVQEMSNRHNAITESLSRLEHYFVKHNIREEIPYLALSVPLLAAFGNPLHLRSQETSSPLSLNEAFFMLGGPIIWSAMFFLIFIFTAIHVVSRRRVVAVSFLGLFLTYYFLALANTTTGSSVPFGSVTMSSFWFVFGGAALVFVLVILLVTVLSAFLV